VIVSVVKLVDFEPQHLLMLKDIEGRLGEGAEKEGEIHKRRGPCSTILIDDEIAACGGIHMFWKGTGEAWMAISRRHIGGHLFKSIRNILDYWIACGPIDRVQAVTTTGWAEGERTMKFLGFEFEAVLHKFGPNGADKSLYARIR
jgi:hypothetical protein